MKKQLLCLAFMSTGLVACGGGGGGEPSGGNTDAAQLTTPAANVLTVKGTGVDKQETITVDKKDILISAIGNQPIQLIEFYQKPESYDWYGRIGLRADSNKVQLHELAFDANSNSFLSCAVNACLENSTFSLQAGSQQSILTISFNQASNTYKTKGSSQSTPVKVSGNLQFGIPSNWPILQTNRFPVANVQGQLLWNGLPYHVSGQPFSERDRFSNQLVHRLQLAGNNGSIELTIKELSATAFKVSVTEGNITYSTNLGLSKSPWQQTQQQIKLDFFLLLPFELTDEAGEKPAKTLTGNLQIPNMVWNVALNGEVPDLVELVGGFAENDSKYYALNLITLDGSTRRSTYLEIRQELDGHLWLDYYGGEDSPSCGSPTAACAGLTVNADKKTYRFNNVRLGDHTLNGGFYIPGVFE
jgi:hypothetical protein